jgi:hypothetical protein
MAAPGTRGTTNRNARGGTDARRRRKLWLLAQPQFGGDGESALCQIGRPGCVGRVTFETVWVDCYPVMRRDGGTYRRDNIRPSCGPCNMGHGGEVGRAVQLGRQA